jgi:transposase-like protein
VDALEGSGEAKARLTAVLRTLRGEWTIEEACRELGLGAARFHEIRREALEGALAALSPRAGGRPALPAEDPEVGTLRARVRDLEQELEVARIRSEIALAMPHVVKPPQEAEKRGSRSPGGRRGTWFR